MTKFLLGIVVGVLLSVAVGKAVGVYDEIQWRLDRIENFLTQPASSGSSGSRS